MNITIQSITVDNFKCFRHQEFVFNKDVTIIRGRNGAGKTTIADAILWCLFGKNIQGQTDFDLKTHDETGKPIPNLDHSVEIRLATVSDGSPSEKTITLKRTLKETWVKRRGSDEQVFKNNTTEYMVNGEVKTAADYKRFISELVSEDIFRAITNPSYFPSLKWQQQRDFLANLAGDISSQDIAAYDADLLSLDFDEDIIAYRKHLSYQIKQVKEKLDRIPVRLEEQNKALPEKLDWDNIDVEIAVKHKSFLDLDAMILALNAGNGDVMWKAEKHIEIDKARGKKYEIEEQIRASIRKQRTEHDERVNEATRKFNALLTNQRDLEAAVASFASLITRCKETADNTFKSEQAYVREHWKETQQDFNATDNRFCPVCHQLLPPEMEEQAREKFNLHKAELKKALTERANAAKQLLVDAEKEVQELVAKKQEAEKSLKETKEAINETFSEKAKLEKLSIPSFEETIANNEEYKEVLDRIESLTKDLQRNTTSEEDAKAIAELEAKKQAIKDEESLLTAQLSSKKQYDRIMSLIEGIYEEQKSLVAQLSELERKEDIARRYQDRQNQILEERINDHFGLVQWRMFRTVNNAGDPFDEPYCECYVNGVAYHDGLNQAARLNAGLDVIRTLCKHYNVTAPIVIDNSESNLNILPTESQQIRLEVFNSDLQIL